MQVRRPFAVHVWRRIEQGTLAQIAMAALEAKWAPAHIMHDEYDGNLIQHLEYLERIAAAEGDR